MHILRGNGAMNLLREKERVNRRNGHHTQLHKSSDAPLPLHSSCSTSRGGDKAGTQQNSKQQQQQQQLPTSGPVHPVPSMTTDHQHRPINHNHSYNNNTDHHHHHHRDGNKKKDLEVVASRGIIPRNTNFISLSPPPPTSIPTQSQTLHPADDHRQQQRQPKKTTFLSRFF